MINPNKGKAEEVFEYRREEEQACMSNLNVVKFLSTMGLYKDAQIFCLLHRGMLLGFMLLYLLTFVVILPFFCHDWVFSQYFSELVHSKEAMIQRAHTLNALRVADAEKYFYGLNAKESKSFYTDLESQKKIDLAIGIVTVQRTSDKHVLKYLTQVMYELDKQVHSDINFNHKVVFLCNTDAGPGVHYEAQNLSNYFPMHQRFSEPSPGHVIMNKYEKEKEDYIFCLEKALDYHPEYVLIIEDDSVPNRDMFSIVHYMLDVHLGEWRNLNSHSSERKNWASLKLFYPEKWAGYSNHILSILGLLSAGCVGGGFFVLMHMIAQSYAEYGRHEPKRSHFMFVGGFIYSILFAFMVGRQNLIFWRHWSIYFHSLIRGKGCCTPAVLYPSKVVGQIAQFLQTVHCRSTFGVDLAIDKFIRDNGFEEWLIEPNVVHHIGLVSTLKSVNKNPGEFIF